jgi:hypothetical protein
MLNHRKGILALSAAALIAGVASALVAWPNVSDLLKPNVFDRYKVIGIVPEPNSNSYAILVDYHHANSSSDVAAVWIGTGDPPKIGAENPLAGDPALISFRSLTVDQFGWRADHQLLVKVPAPVTISENEATCYFEDVTANTMCLRSSQIDIIASQGE